MKDFQIRYALERLSAVEAEKVKAAETACLLSEDAVPKPVTIVGLQQMIKSGMVKPLKIGTGYDTSIGRHTQVSSVFDIASMIERNERISRGQQKVDGVKFTALKAAIGKESTRIKDELILGDAKGALAMIEAFTKKKF